MRRKAKQRVRSLVCELADMDQFIALLREDLARLRAQCFADPSWALMARECWSRIELADFLRDRRRVERKLKAES